MRRLATSSCALALALLALAAGRLKAQSADCRSDAAEPDLDAPAAADAPIVEPPRPVVSVHPLRKGSIHWQSLLEHEFLFLSFEHSFRLLTQEKTREALSGPFFHDWLYIAGHVQWNRWSDGDKWFTSNLAHPAQGDVVAWIYRYNDDSASGLELDLRDPRYRRMLLRTWLAAAIYSAQWKLGPLSEATVGHVGLHTDLSSGANRTGLNDYTLDSFGGIPLMLLGDAADKYGLKRLERRMHGRAAIDTMRVALDPCRAIANIMMFKKPWYRDSRD